MISKELLRELKKLSKDQYGIELEGENLTATGNAFITAFEIFNRINIRKQNEYENNRNKHS